MPLLDWDAWGFVLFNQQWVNPLLDRVMPFITDFDHWKPLFAAGGIWLLWRGGSKGRWTVAMVALGVLLSDRGFSHTLKHYVARPRPVDFLPYVRLLSDGGGFAFPSGHAANSWMLAVIIGQQYPAVRWIAWGLAAVIGYSRIYVGDHYPLDVLAGTAIGIGCGAFVVWLFRRWGKGSAEAVGGKGRV